MLRHTFASRLAEKGVSLVAIKELMGHAEVRTTMRYAHLSQLTLRQAIRVLEHPKNISLCHNSVTNDNFGENSEAKFVTQKVNFMPVNTKETSV
jgi:hypothetical protein